MEHEFTATITRIIQEDFAEHADAVFRQSELLGYLNQKTRSASRGSKSRSSFGNLYAIYVLVEDYVRQGFLQRGDYNRYDGARFSDLLTRLRSLPFGSKLQNHALNHRVNQEFAKFFPICDYQPILRDAETRRYWLNENLLHVNIGDHAFNIALTVIKIVDEYIEEKRDSFETFIKDCERIVSLQESDPGGARAFISGLLKPNVDARVFEIVSYAILREFYGSQSIFWGWTMDEIHSECLVLYKTGRTNANDGGIDFVMKPLGRFFQVTETVDTKKYFLDIDKIQRFPLTFVVKSNESPETLRKRIEADALSRYSVSKIVSRYMSCIEEIINIGGLQSRFEKVVDEGHLGKVIAEIVLQSKVEFNYEVP